MRIRQVVIDSNDPYRLAKFWSLATGREVMGKADPYLILEDSAGQDVTLLIQRVDDDIKPGKEPRAYRPLRPESRRGSSPPG
jgi:hypothetical protein